MKKQSFMTLPITAYIILATGCSTPNSLHRHVAEWRFGQEQFTTQTATASPAVAGGGQEIYTKTFPLSSDQNRPTGSESSQSIAKLNKKSRD